MRSILNKLKIKPSKTSFIKFSIIIVLTGIIGIITYREVIGNNNVEIADIKQVEGISTSLPEPSATTLPSPIFSSTPKPTPKPTTTATPTATPQPTSNTTNSNNNSSGNPTPTPTPTSTPSTNNVSIGHLPIKGQSSAKVTIIEFSDFQCPYCKSFFSNTHSQIESEYINTGKVKFAYRHYPLNFHANAEVAAQASECANEQGKFWEMHNKLFNEQSSWGPQSLDEVKNTFKSYSSSLGLDSSKFEQCLNDNKYLENVSEDKNAAKSLSVSGTPTFYINGQVLNGALPFDSFKTIIEQELAK